MASPTAKKLIQLWLNVGIFKDRFEKFQFRWHLAKSGKSEFSLQDKIQKFIILF